MFVSGGWIKSDEQSIAEGDWYFFRKTSGASFPITIILKG